jgi:hypothetical protein
MTDDRQDPPSENGHGEQKDPPKPGRADDELRSLVEEIVSDQKKRPAGESPSEAREITHEHAKNPDVDEPKDPDHDPLAELRGILPKSEEQLRALVREIVGEVLQDVEAVRRAAEEPVQIVAIPRMFVPRIHLTPKQWTWTVATLVVLIGAPLTWIKWPRTVEIPDGAVGLWTTMSPRYMDRAFRIGKTALTIHVSSQDSTYHPIVRVESDEDQEEDATLYTVFYTHYGDEYEFNFLYDEAPDTTIRFVNQREMVWRKGSL